MRKIFTKKLIKKLIVAVIAAVLVVLILGILALVFVHEIYKYRGCETYSLSNGNITENRIKGTVESTGLYANSFTNSCAQTLEKDDDYYEDKGLYTETKSCQNSPDGKARIVTSFEKCEFGCFAGSCMSECSNPEDNNFFKGAAYGIESSLVGLSPEQAKASRLFDYCTDSQGKDELLISKVLAERVCDPDNYVSSNLVQCADICYNGACKTSDFRYCNDSDQGDQGKMKGTVTYYDPNSKEPKTLSDSCQNPKTVTEYFCGTDRMSHRIFLTCRKGCSDGQCLQ